jgi:predicted nucleic acid-binding protein
VILVDTSVLSFAFRRRTKSSVEAPQVKILRRLVAEDHPIVVPGVVLQELLSGVKTSEEFERLQGLMDGFPLLLATREHHILAAKISNACRQAGIAVSIIDCLIAAMTIAAQSQLLTADEDFKRMATHCGLCLYV